MYKVYLFTVHCNYRYTIGTQCSSTTTPSYVLLFSPIPPSIKKENRPTAEPRDTSRCPGHRLEGYHPFL